MSSAQNSSTKQQNCAEMTAEQLREIQDRIKFDAPSMALCIGVPYQTYRNYLYGANVIPVQVVRAIRELEQINVTFTAKAPARIDAQINKEYPHGIPSEL